MRKYKAIICLCMALTILCGSSLTAFASETVETEETMETETVEDEGIYFDGLPPKDADGYYHYWYKAYTGAVETGSTSGNGYIRIAHVKCKTPLVMTFYEDSNGIYKFDMASSVEVNSGRETGYYNWLLGVENESFIYTYVTENMETIWTQNGSFHRSFDVNKELGGYVYTDMPIMSHSAAYNYLLDGDESGVVNKPPVPEDDETFAFVDFECNEYISATWSGTTLDDKKDTFDDMGFEVNVAYAYDNSFQIAVNEVIVTNGDISANRWSRMQKALQHEDASLYLRAVSFTPYYEKYGQICRGKSEIIWLKMDGNKDYLPNDELTMIEDSSFYLRGVSVENSALGLVDGDVRSHISWTGTTKDDMIVEVPLDKTYADILCLCYTPTYKITYVDLYELDPEFMGGKPLPLRKALNDSTQAFYINYTDIDEAATAQGLNFGGKLYITPYFFYEPDNAIYKGAVTVIDILDNEIEKNPDTGDIYVPDISATPTPSANPSASPDMGEDDDILSDDLNFEKALPTFWKMLKSLWASMGQFPELMYSLFPYLPKELYYILGIMLIGVIIFRFIGR